MSNNLQQYAIGVDIGGTNTKYGIVNHRGDISHSGRMSTSEFLTAEAFVAALYSAILPAIDAVGVENIKGIGVGAPNANYFTGSIEHAPNLNWKGIVPFARLISERFHLPCSITNDANAAAVGEMMYGAAKGMKDFIVITLGTGVGSGIVTSGHLIYGHDGFAGELGHTVVRHGGRQHWSTEIYGSLEAYASATGIAITAREMIAGADKQSLLKQYPLEEIDSKAVYECAMKGDEIAKEVYRFTGQILGEALANFVMFSSPEAIILFGGVTKAGNLIMDPVREHMEKNLLAVFRNKVMLTFSELKEADAAILGASALVWEIKR
ncbi:ROK family protein [Pontibacter toksunensis]|uniref:ROK family protein n=1 Tax=Pontibacter toksunensis TaxID=1332631 RepID=A0ABW6BW63_9BACT